MKKLLLASLAFTVTAFAPARADDRPVLIVVGMASEADIARGDETSGTIVVGAMNENALRAHLASLDPRKFRAVISFGVAGGLDPTLKSGDVVVATEVLSGDARWLAGLTLNEDLIASVALGRRRVIRGRLAGAEQVVAGR
ncbi:MAG: phosphorylase family protein, partial [Bdellovibrionota bacterium]